MPMYASAFASLSLSTADVPHDGTPPAVLRRALERYRALRRALRERSRVHMKSPLMTSQLLTWTDHV